VDNAELFQMRDRLADRGPRDAEALRRIGNGDERPLLERLSSKAR
jgi:hypothetical protein